MLVLDDAREGNLAFGIVHHRIALPVRRIDRFSLETQRAILKIAQLVIEIFIDRAAVDDAISNARMLFDERAEFRVQQNLRIAEHLLDHSRVATHGNALETVVEIVVVVGEAHGQSRDDGAASSRGSVCHCLAV